MSAKDGLSAPARMFLAEALQLHRDRVQEAEARVHAAANESEAAKRALIAAKGSQAVFMEYANSKVPSP